jgi:hypothetical protein
MKQLFYLSLAFLAITGCRKIEMDGEKEIFVVTKEVAPVLYQVKLQKTLPCMQKT